MKIRIHLDVNKSYQIAIANIIECGESKLSIFPLYDDQKRYEVVVEVPHPTDAEAIKPVSVGEQNQ